MKKKLIRLSVGIIILYLALLIPDRYTAPTQQPANTQFKWNKDSFWLQLEKDFATAKALPDTILDSMINVGFGHQENLFKQFQDSSSNNDLANNLLQNFFSLSALVAAKPIFVDSLIRYYTKVRTTVKEASQSWDLQDINRRALIYQLLYGMRASTEEVLLQKDSLEFNPIINVQDEKSVTPSAVILGMTVHSGDLLVSRGGAEVSALISRGNDFPGNFSHVALLYIDEKNNKPYLIEAHIEKGVAIANVDEYIKDKKMRLMVLRPRFDLSQMKVDPMLPHKAAEYAYQKALEKHIPYDFQMNFNDTTALFCSEVGSLAYKHEGIQLWKSLSTISSKGIINWLHAFGVENFVTQMPSDLEYDPQLAVIAEWRNMETLRKDHIDNAVMDVLLEQANAGKQIRYNFLKLPFVRIVKGYCLIQNYFGKAAIIPEGMSATQALKNQYFVNMYAGLKSKTVIAIDQFIKEHHYYPPYWQIEAMVKKVAE